MSRERVPSIGHRVAIAILIGLCSGAALSCARRLAVDVRCSVMSQECTSSAGPFHYDATTGLYRMHGPYGCFCEKGFVPPDSR